MDHPDNLYDRFSFYIDDEVVSEGDTPEAGSQVWTSTSYTGVETNVSGLFEDEVDPAVGSSLAATLSR